MTRKRANTDTVRAEGNRRVVRAPVEPTAGDVGDCVDGGDDSPAPPFVRTSRQAVRNDSGRRSAAATLKTVGRVVLTGLLLGGLSASVVLGTYRFAQTSPRFALKQIDVDGLRHRSRENILGLTQLSLGKNIFSIDTAAVEQRLLSDPWILDAKVERRLPQTVRIELVESEAGALALVGDQMLIVSRAGTPFKRYELGDPADLPLITGVSVEEPGKDPALERRRIATALEVLRHYDRSGLSRIHAAQEVHLAPGGDVSLTVGKSGIALHLGLGPWAKKLVMAERVLGKLRGQKGALAAVFLDNRAHPERVVVRMR